MVDRDELLRRTDLAALLDELSPQPAVRLGPSVRWRCIDPDHDDLHPSITMFTDHRGVARWRCWSGGHGGTAIDALVVARGLRVGEAIDELARRARLDLHTAELTRRPSPVNRPAMVPLDPCVTDYVRSCEQILWARPGQPVVEWLVDERRLDPDVLRVNHVGADPGPALLARAAGLPRGGVAAVLPALTVDGTVAYVQARYLQPPEGRAKYDNPAGRLATNPRLAWSHAPRPIRPDLLVVCEGLPDALTAATAGVASVAILGASYPDAHVVRQIVDRSNGRRMMLAFDNDRAGVAAAERVHDLLARHEVTVDRLDLPDGTDLNDLARRDPAWAGSLAPPLTVVSPTPALRITSPSR
jgi:DNA primase